VLHGISLVKDISPKIVDAVSAYGELLSAAIVAEYFSCRLPTAAFVDARALIVTNDNFGKANVDFVATNERIRAFFEAFKGVAVITGFIGATAEGVTTTLGRGGSDYTAAILACALEAEEIQIWTNVDGLMTADPGKVRKAFTIPALSYEDAMELTHFGADVVYPPAIQPAFDADIPIRVKNSLKPDTPGSIIQSNPPESREAIVGITSARDVSLFCLQGSGMAGVAGVASRLFDALSREDISVILISQASSEQSICFAVPRMVQAQAKHAVDQEFKLEIAARDVLPLTQEPNRAIVAVVGTNMRNTPGIAARAFQALGRNGINVCAIAQGSSEYNISIVIESEDESKALNALHDAFFLSEHKTINLFFVGTGNVGKTLLKQIKEHSASLFENLLELNLVAAANSRRMKFDVAGLDPAACESIGDESEVFSIDTFVARMKELNLPNCIFVDCTASDLVAARYEEILSASISIATPNKRGNSGSYEQYLALRRGAERGNVKYFYETTVGAGLPVIGTLKDLILSGDRVHKIEAVLSGTLSFIFNSFTSDRSFSEVVREAKEKGYTEPDPRDDLSGTDVARKLLVLARETGIALELSDVEVESLVPEQCENAADVNTFFEQLTKSDAAFARRIEEAETAKQKLRYIGILENGSARVSLEAVGEDHPFYALSGSDNIISFVTQRYCDCPLVVKGPGAGTDVTAAGVFADIIRIASYLS
jgi:aspartokinase/homoserine dehydrogenase 1